MVADAVSLPNTMSLLESLMWKESDDCSFHAYGKYICRPESMYSSESLVGTAPHNVPFGTVIVQDSSPRSDDEYIMLRADPDIIKVLPCEALNHVPH